MVCEGEHGKGGGCVCRVESSIACTVVLGRKGRPDGANGVRVMAWVECFSNECVCGLDYGTASRGWIHAWMKVTATMIGVYEC